MNLLFDEIGIEKILLYVKQTMITSCGLAACFIQAYSDVHSYAAF